MQQKIIILDFGSQTTQLIGRRVRELDTFCEILPYNKFPKDDPDVIGVILSGSPFSVYDKEAFKIDLDGIRGKYPVLGICYGAQYMSYVLGGAVEPAGTREYGRANLAWFDRENPLFKTRCGTPPIRPMARSFGACSSIRKCSTPCRVPCC